jgi:hypothetical protein
MGVGCGAGGGEDPHLEMCGGSPPLSLLTFWTLGLPIVEWAEPEIFCPIRGKRGAFYNGVVVGPPGEENEPARGTGGPEADHMATRGRVLLSGDGPQVRHGARNRGGCS